MNYYEIGIGILFFVAYMLIGYLFAQLDNTTTILKEYIFDMEKSMLKLRSRIIELEKAEKAHNEDCTRLH